MKLSLIVPIYNEEKNIARLYHTITKTMELNQYDYELIMVNDGSRDHSLPLIENLSFKDTRVKYISFSRNFGKEAAMLAGLEAAAGDAAVILDADLQHPPELIPQLVNAYHAGFNQVVARRNRRGEPLFRRLPTTFFYALINNAVDVKLTDGEGDFRLLSRPVIDAILSLDEYNRFSKGIYDWVGFNKKTIEFDNVARENGSSAFSFFKLIDYAIDGILSYNNKPLRVCFYFGAFTLSVCLAYILVTLIQIIQSGIDEPGYFTIISAILFLGGVQLFSLGIIGEYIGKIYYETKRRPHYLIQHANIEEKDAES
ncbi:glycosyltransferase family 2 protein [Macrococcus equipercicus]|uniref:Glycosyltransferase family 2 protein n=1 Tax=Macrococcus equipercicus TaxID=69967 RepID=A0ABQ6R6M7_9STAP|nr:glycosyltransferase family 2 protein [Macrococcus equipercicus]KAA1036949.1 glycosyltransferase family 2 protein [Macrococcus equipercicus]